MKIGKLYRVKSEKVYLVDTITRKEKELAKGDLVTLVDIVQKTTIEPVVFVDNFKYQLYFDAWNPDCFETLFEELNEI